MILAHQSIRQVDDSWLVVSFFISIRFPLDHAASKKNSNELKYYKDKKYVIIIKSIKLTKKIILKGLAKYLKL